MFNKRGVDAVVATVLIIMITVAAVAVIWLTIIPMIKTSLESSTEGKVVLTIETDASYTTWDEATKTLRVQVKRGADEANLTGIQFIFTNSTGSVTNISGTIEKGLAKVYTFENLLTTKPIKVAIAPVTKKGIGEVVSETSDIRVFAGTITQNQVSCVSGLDGGNIVICNCEDLQNISENLDGSYILGKDIDCLNKVPLFEPVGKLSNPFTGVFDGKSYTISNLVINKPTDAQVGLFGFVTNADIYDLKVLNANIKGRSLVGIVAGESINSIFRNVNVSGNLNGTDNIGGVSGFFYSGSSIIDSYSFANITITSNAGGILIGSTDSAFIINSSSSGSIRCSGSCGGIVGAISATNIDGVISDANVFGLNTCGGVIGSSVSSTIYNSYATGSIANGTTIGGFIGYSEADFINNSYSTGNLNGTVNVGGFAGQISYGSVTNNTYATGEVISSGSTVGGYVGVLSSSSYIYNSYATGNVTTHDGSDWTGGFAGGLYDSAYIYNSYATGNVLGGIQTGGFTGLVGVGAEIYNSYATGSVIGTEKTGGFVGNLNDGDTTISNSYATGSVTGTSQTGGFAGYILGFVLNSYATGSVTGTSQTGGFVGSSESSAISNCYATGKIIGEDIVGGFCGELYSQTSAISTYASGNVSGTSNVGGFCGMMNWNGEGATIADSFSTGSVTGTSVVGAFLGYHYGAIDNLFYLSTNNLGLSCSGLEDYSSGTCTAKNNLDWFYSSSNPPMNAWSPSVWNFGSSFPTLK